MAVTYKNNEIKLSSSDQKFNVDVVYARPEDIIKLDFVLENVKVTFINGDVDIIFPNGSVISLASYGTLAFDSNAPKIYDANGNLITLEALLQKVQVLNPEDSILILANRDKSQLVQNQEQVDRIIMSGDQTGSEESPGVIITGVGDNSIKTVGVISNIVDVTGNSYNFNLNKGIGDYLANNYTSFLRGTTDNDNILPGNTTKENTPKFVYNFLFGDVGIRGADRTINGQAADYYGVIFGVGESTETKTQLNPIDMSSLGGSHQNKIFDSHSIDGKIKRILKLDYSGGIFPQSILISGIPADLDSSGQKIFNLVMLSGGTTKLTYDPAKNTYLLNQLDVSGKVKLNFIFNDSIEDQTIMIKYIIIYFDPRTGAEKVLDITQDVGIRTVTQSTDLNLNSAVINKGASGLIVNSDNAGTGNKIFIGGNVENKFTSTSGNSLVFTGNGNDTIDLASGDNLIYGSTGYNFITGSGTENNWLVFSGEKKYNEKFPGTNKYFMESSAIKDSYYNTLKKGVSLQFYLGVPKDKIISLWEELGYTGDPGGLKTHATSNFIRTFSSLTVIGDRNGKISIKNIVSTKELDTFNLYFTGVVQKVNLYSSEKNISGITNQIILHTEKGNNVLVNYGADSMSTVIDQRGSAYNFQTYYFNKITTKGKGNFTINLCYDETKEESNIKSFYRKDAYFIAGEGQENTADFSGIKFDYTKAYIEFDADARHSAVKYVNLKNKAIDYFQGFNHIISSKGNDIFYGNSNSKGYIFECYTKEADNVVTLTYERSIGGVTFDANTQKIYKINSKNIDDYSKYNETADTFIDIKVIKLSSLDNVILAADNNNIGEKFELYLGNANNTIRYDYDTNITAAEVFSDELKVIKSKQDSRIDVFKKANLYGTIEFVGSKGDNLFHGGFKYANIFSGGKSSNNTLSYEKYANDASSPNITVDLFKSTVFKSGKIDTFINIQNIIGGKGDDSFSLGNVDPTNAEQMKKIDSISLVDGGAGNNVFRFNSVNISNLNQDDFALIYNAETGDVIFYDKNHTQINLKILVKNINTIYGTLAKNKFIASKDQDFTFDGIGVKDACNPGKNKACANTLDYSHFENDLIVDLTKEVVIKNIQKEDSTVKQDKFKNIQHFITGSGNDKFLANYSLEKKLMIFDGCKGNNTLEYQNTSISIFFDFSKGIINFGESDTIKHYFFNITTFIGGSGENIFKLFDRGLIFLTEKDNNGVTITLGNEKDNSRVIIDFDLWSTSIGTKDDPFKISAGAGSISNGKEGQDSITYKWFKSNGFFGSKQGSYFVLVNDEGDLKNSITSFKLDGNKDAEESVLDYSSLDIENLKLTLNISDGSILKQTSNQFARDTISNFKTIILSKYDDTVKLLDNIKDNLKSLKLIDGGAGNNTLDFSLFNKDLDVEITKEGLHLSKIENLNIVFTNFQKMLSSRGNSIFRVTNDSAGANVEIGGNSNLGNNKYTILDLTAIKNINYWNLIEEDNPSDPSYIGKLTWENDQSAKIVTRNISQVKIGEGKNTIYGSLYNHTHYIGSNSADTVNKVDYSNIEKKDVLIVTINGDKQSVKFNNHGTKDDFTNFHYFLTSKNNDIFAIESLDKINTLTLDGNEGDNTLSFAPLSKSINVDISLEELKIENASFKILKISNLVLTKNNDTVIVSDGNKKDLLFKTVDGLLGTNIFDVRDGSTITFNEKGDNKLLLSKHNEIKISNFYHLKTNTLSGNRFFNNYSNSMKFEVVGITEDKNITNLLSYRNSAGVKIDFNKCEVYKGSNNAIDKFSGINYFEGSSVIVNTFYLAKVLYSFSDSDSNKALKTIYINMDFQNFDGRSQGKDIIDISKAGDNSILYVVKQKLEGSDIQYKWNNISVFKLTNNQTIYVSFDENFKYEWVSTEHSLNRAKVNNVALVFSNKYGKDGKEYKDGYVVIDTTIGKAHTYDVSDKQLAEITFNNISVIKGTGSNKDIFYGSIHNIEYYGSDAIKKECMYKINPKDGTFGSGTLSYQKFFNNDGIKVIFNADNSATITENTLNPTSKLDKSYGISTYIGSMKDDSFVIAKNKNAGRIIIDGNGGVFNNVDYSQISDSGKGIELDTTLGLSLGDFDYVFKNISVFKLTASSDKVFGSLDNAGFINKGSNALSADIIIDGNGGTDNTIDYTKYLKGTKDNIISVNADLNIATISKEGKNKDGKLISSNDTIAIVDQEANKTQINFQKIILSGEYVSNILTVSGREHDMKIYVEVKNPTEDIIQFLNFEFVDQKIDIVWDGQNINSKHTNIYLTNLNGKYFSFIGFNSVNLSKQDSTLTIKKDANLITKGGSLNGGKGTNTLIVDNNDTNNSSVLVNTSSEKIEFDLKGNKKCTYSIYNFQKFFLGCMTNKFFTNDSSSFTIVFTNKNAFNEVNFTELNSTYIVLDFKQITNDGATLVVSKNSLFNNALLGKDTITNVNNLVLTNYDDTVEIIEGPNLSKKITIDAARGNNTLSFKKWNSVVDLSKINDKGNIEIGNYILKNFSNITLRDKDDEISLNEKSKLNIDGGGGTNKVTYTGNFMVNNEPGGVIIKEFESPTQAGAPSINGTIVSKSTGYVDILLRFNYFILPKDCENAYTALFVNLKNNNPKTYTIDFNYISRNKSLLNTMDYSKLENASSSILVNVNVDQNSKVLIDVFRDQTKKSNCITDRLFNLNNIIGSVGGGDTFNITGDYNTRLTINASDNKASTLKVTMNNNNLKDGNITTWNLFSYMKNIQQSTQTDNYLNFRGKITNIEVTSTPKDNSQVDNEFIIKDSNEAYNIIYNVTKNRTKNAIYGKLNLSEFKSENEIKINVTQIADKNELQCVKVEVSQAKSNTIRIFGVEYILGSSISKNVFEIANENVSKSPNNVIYLIGNTNFVKSGDNVKINGNQFLQKMNMFAENNFGGIRLNTDGGKNADYYIKNIYTYLINDVSEFIFYLTKSPVYFNNYKFEVTGSSKFILNIGKDVPNLEAILDKSGIYFSDRQLGIKFVSNVIHQIRNENQQPLPITVKNLDPNTELTFNIFNNINLQEYQASHDIKISSSADDWYIKVNKLTFNGKYNISPIIHLSNIVENDHRTRIIDIALDFKDINKIFENINIYAPKFNPQYSLKLNFVSNTSVLTTVTIGNTKDKPNEYNLNLINQANNISRGNIFYHNANSIKSLEFDNGLTHQYSFKFNNFTTPLEIKLNQGASLKVDFGEMAHVQSPLIVYRYLINFGNISFDIPLRDGDGLGRFNNYNVEIILPNFTEVGIGYGITNQYVGNLLKGSNAGNFSIKAKDWSDKENTLFASKPVGEYFSTDIPDGHTLKVMLDYNNNSVLDFNFLGITTNDNKFIKGNFLIKGVKVINPAYLGFWSASTEYTITSVNQSLVIGNDLKEGSYKKIDGAIIFAGKNNANIDLKNGEITFTLSNTLQGGGMISNYSIVTNNITKFDFSKITNCSNFAFYVPLVYYEDDWEKRGKWEIKAPYYADDKLKITDIKNIKDFPINYFEVGSTILAISDILLDIDGRTANINLKFGYNVRKNTIKLENITKYKIEARNGAVVSLQGDKSLDMSYILDSISYTHGFYNNLIYNLKGSLEYANGVVKKSGGKSGTVYDLVGGFRKIEFKNALDVVLYFSHLESSYNTDGEKSVYNFYIEGDKITNVFINLDDIPQKYNNVTIYMKDINSLTLSCGKDKTYLVFRVSDSEYCNKNDEMVSFDTSGYFVIFDNASKMKLYFTGKNIEEFGKEFEKLTNQGIKLVNNYKELMESIEDPNLATDIYEPHLEIDNSDINFNTNINYENTNHSSNVFFEEEEVQEDQNTEDFYSIYQDIQQQDNNEDFSILNNIDYNNEEDLNIFTEEEDINNLYANFTSQDILEFFNDNIDSIFNNSEDAFLEMNTNHQGQSSINNFESDNNYREDNQDDINDFLEVIQELNTVESLNIDSSKNSKNNELLISESTIDNDPSSKIEDSMHKQNTINGNYCK